jgi:hypothetical protein
MDNNALFKNTRKIVLYLSMDQCLTSYLEDLATALRLTGYLKG